uniref:(northern house mosquito) hypothetical protein n=1 Tax=Culex pipiens TaxID=7175 RepID=A0A8D8FMF8_CULPI
MHGPTLHVQVLVLLQLQGSPANLPRPQSLPACLAQKGQRLLRQLGRHGQHHPDRAHEHQLHGAEPRPGCGPLQKSRTNEAVQVLLRLPARPTHVRRTHHEPRRKDQSQQAQERRLLPHPGRETQGLRVGQGRHRPEAPVPAPQRLPQAAGARRPHRRAGRSDLLSHLHHLGDPENATQLPGRVALHANVRQHCPARRRQPARAGGGRRRARAVHPLRVCRHLRVAVPVVPQLRSEWPHEADAGHVRAPEGCSLLEAAQPGRDRLVCVFVRASLFI